MSRYLASTIVLTVLLLACQGNGGVKQLETDRNHADSLLYLASEGDDAERLLFLTDSLQEAGAISVWKAAIPRYGVAANQGNVQQCVTILRDAIKQGKPDNRKDSLSYFFCVTNLAGALVYQSHYEEALRTATAALEPVKTMDEKYGCSDLVMTLYDVITDSQAGLRMMDEAEKTAEEAYVYAVKATKQVPNASTVQTVLYQVYGALVRLQGEKQYEAAEKWLDRSDSLIRVLLTYDEQDTTWTDVTKGRSIICHAKNALGLKQYEAAEKAYKEFLKTDYAQTDEGRIIHADYLYQAGRWSEAADLMEGMEKFLADRGMDMSLDNLCKLGMKFMVNYKAGRRDVALSVANNIIENLDSALIHQRESNAAELATIYDTQGKERQIAEQQAELLQQRIIGLIVAIVLLTIFFVIYTLVRRRHAHRMAEMRAAQERIESELQIARNIQMSMVPSQFPDYEGLDMYASMTPAKEVGGDLYGYVLMGDKLYFALGDVSGKGVPASLFMAQATRLFRTLAAQQMMPAEICTRMNDALSGEDNESGMFVTFFLGLVDLKTGHLDFCNAGHNPPVIGGGESHGEFLDMIPNAPIGLWPGLEYEGEEIESIKGRPLFIYTDGLNEAENRQQEQFGDDRLLDILCTTHFDTARQVIDILKAEVERHRDGAEPNDDLTMMCVRIAE